MSIAELHQLSNIEKFKIIEILWNDLVNEDAVPSPDCHAEKLKTTEEKVKSGTEKIWDLTDAKEYLRSRK